MSNSTFDQILKLRHQRLSLREIGKRVGMSASAVRAQLLEHGVINVPADRYIDPARAQRYYGCTPEQIKTIQAGKKLSDNASPAYLYTMQRKRYQRSPGWNFTFTTWWKFWRDHWERRVPSRLVMLAIDATKPIGPGNVRIGDRSEVSRLGHRTRRKAN